MNGWQKAWMVARMISIGISLVWLCLFLYVGLIHPRLTGENAKANANARNGRDVGSSTPRSTSKSASSRLESYRQWAVAHMDRLKQAQDQYDRWDDAYKSQGMTATTIRAKVAALPKALEPFQALQMEAHSQQPPTEAVPFHRAYCAVLDNTVTSLRRMNQVLYILYHPGENGMTLTPEQTEAELNAMERQTNLLEDRLDREIERLNEL